MSAYVVSTEHIAALVGGYFALCRTRPDDLLAPMAQVLMAENVRSVNHRYPHHTPEVAAQVSEELCVRYQNAVSMGQVSAAALLKSLDCYTYQACEHPGWGASEAHRICMGMRAAFTMSLAGYFEADWGAPKIADAAGMTRSKLIEAFRAGLTVWGTEDHPLARVDSDEMATVWRDWLNQEGHAEVAAFFGRSLAGCTWQGPRELARVLLLSGAM